MFHVKRSPGTTARSTSSRTFGALSLAAIGLTACASNGPARDTAPTVEPLAPSQNTRARTVDPTPPISATAAGVPSPPPNTAPPATAKKLTVHVVPLGPVPEATLASLVAGLEGHADIQARVHPAVPLSDTRKAKRAGRYLAHDMLQVLARTPETEGGKVLGVTEVDIVAEKDGNPEWGVLGLGSIDGKSCVLSTFRMRRAWDHGGADEPTVRSRLWKTAVHEVGHTLGLEHCPVQGCVMEDGHGTVATTDRETDLCPSCAARYKRAIVSVSPAR